MCIYITTFLTYYFFDRDRKGKKGKGKKEKEPTSPNVASPNDVDKEFDVAVPQQVRKCRRI